MDDPVNRSRKVGGKTVYKLIKSKDSKKGVWTRVGVAFENEKNTHIILDDSVSGDLYIFRSNKKAKDKTTGTPTEASLQ